MSQHQHFDSEKANLASTNGPPAHTSASNGVSAPVQFRVLANPAPLGLFGFASTTFILSMYNVQARGITHPNVVVGMAIFVGGLAQFVAGMWEFACANSFGATAFTMYGGFWMSFATIFIPGFGIGGAYTSESEFNSALGIYLFTWFIITFLLLVAATRLTIAFIGLFFFLDVTFLLLGSAHFVSSASTVRSLEKAGGALGIVTAFIAFYIGLSALLSNLGHRFYFNLPVGPIKTRKVD